jgi:AraC-like DNA-binding protein
LGNALSWIGKDPAIDLAAYGLVTPQTKPAMSIVLSDTTWNDLWQESWQSARSADPTDPHNDFVVEYPASLANGFKRDIELRNGILLTLHNYQMHDDLKVISTSLETTGVNCLEFVFNLSSTNRYWNGNYVTAGQHYLVPHAESGKFYCEELAEEPKVAVDIHLEPIEFKTLMGEDVDRLPRDLQRIIAGETASFTSPFQPITPAMRVALEQILQCPYQGIMKQLYLESKSIELLVLFLDQAIAHQPKVSPALRLQPDDVDRIHQARQILIQQMDNPPSLLMLAHQVGLNDCTLKRGFRQVFGTTVFGYLHDYRMNRARQLLQEQRMTVQEVARQVGYASPSSFHAAFRKKFGVNPGTYLAMPKQAV